MWIEKYCNQCGLVKPAADFHRKSDCPSGLVSCCKPCVKARDAAAWAASMADPVLRAAVQARKRAYVERNWAKEQARMRQYRLVHRARRLLVSRAYKQAHPEAVRNWCASRRARKRGAAVYDLTAAQWCEIKQAYDYRCVYCGKKSQRLSMDHITPLSQGGSHTLHNVVPACRLCNGRKFTGPPPVPVQPLLLTTC